MAAADRIFGLLPPDQGEHFLGLWHEFEAQTTSEARFAHARAMDRILQRVLPLSRPLYKYLGFYATK